MILEDIAGKNANCGGVSANTGTLGCQIEWNTPLHLIGVTKGFVIPKETNFNLDYINTKIQEGKFIPLIGAETFENESSEDQFSTNSRGVERLNTLGLPKYKFMYEEGHEFYRQMAKLTSYKALDFMFIDEAGNWRVAVDANGDFGGFSVGQAVAQMTNTKVLGGDPESKAFTVQVLDRIQWDQDYTILIRSELGFAPESIDGVNGVDISFSTIPTDAATTVTVDVVLASDRNTPVEGLAAGNFRLLKGGVAETPSLLAENSAGNYTLTVVAIATGNVVSVGTYDAAKVTDRILVEAVLFRGVSADETVLA